MADIRNSKRYPFLDELLAGQPAQRDESGLPVFDPTLAINDPMNTAQLPEPPRDEAGLPIVQPRPDMTAAQDQQMVEEPLLMAPPVARKTPLMSTPSTLVAGDAAPIAGESEAPRVRLQDLEASLDDRLKRAQEERRSTLSGSLMNRGADQILGGMARIEGGDFKGDENFYKAQENLAGMPVQNIEESQTVANKDLANKRLGNEVASEAEMNDPTSAVSSQMRDMAEQQLGKKLPPNVTAAQVSKLLPGIQGILDSKNKQLDRELQERLKRMDVQGKQDIASLKASQKGGAMNEFEKQKLRGFGKSAATWATQDRQVLEGNANKIDNALAIMADNPDVSGPGKGSIPSALRSFTNPRAVEAQESVQSAIMDTLRPTLGAQFTENEGKRIQALAFNPDLPVAENMRRAKELQTFIDKKIKATDALYDHIAETGSDKGFDYAAYGMRAVGTRSPDATKTAEKTNTNSGKVRVTNGTETLEIDASDLADAESDGFKRI